MTLNFDKVEDIIILAVKEYKVQLMGDEFIGYKFVGEHKDFWNQILTVEYEKGEDFSFLNSSWLAQNGIEVLEFNSDVWNL